MPTYEYSCDKCGNLTTILRSVDEAAQEYTCSDCGNVLTRVWNTPGIVFKGGGWGGQG